MDSIFLREIIEFSAPFLLKTELYPLFRFRYSMPGSHSREQKSDTQKIFPALRSYKYLFCESLCY